MEKQRKRLSRKARIISCFSAACLLVALVGVLVWFGKYQETAAGDGEVVVRGVVDKLGEFVSNDYDKSADIGTPEHPFLILEIVPYEEYAEIGYLIEGCEPIAVEEMYGRQDLVGTANSISGINATQYTAYFFGEEPEISDSSMYDSELYVDYNDRNSRKGYYELVEEGKGKFTREIDEQGNVTFAKDSKGNLIWHTVNEYEVSKYDTQFDDLRMKELKQIGDRIYTYRIPTQEDPVTRAYYMYYTNDNLFLKDTLMLDEEAAANYSIVVKTITPQELNQNPEWIDYANLVYLSNNSHVGKLVESWKTYNRLGHTSNVTNYVSNAFLADENFDLQGEIILNLYKKLIAKSDYCALILDDTIFNNPQGDSKSVTMDIYDVNLKKTGRTYGNFTGYKSNVYKLCLMLLCMDTDWFQRLYLDADNPVVQVDANHHLIDTLQADDAAMYWSVNTFLVVPSEWYMVQKYGPYYNVYTYWNSAEAWEQMGMSTTITNSKYWVKNRVFDFPGTSCLAQYYTGAYNGWEAKYTEFWEYLAGEEIGKADVIVNDDGTVSYKIGDGSIVSVSDAVRFILGMPYPKENIDEKTNVLEVLDLEPSVGVTYTSAEDGGSGTEPDWQATENYIRLLTGYEGEIHVTHMTTAEYNCKSEDINSKYQAIYLGLDYSAYNTSAQYDGHNYGVPLPDWNDNSLDGLIYLHTGDMMYSSELVTVKSNRDKSVKYVYDSAADQTNTSTELRFMGNDISSLKKAELEDYAASGYPLIADIYLYELNTRTIDSDSYIYQLVKALKKKNEIYSINETSKITAMLNQVRTEVVFTELPVAYDGTTSTTESADLNPTYLPTNSSKRAYLRFRFDLTKRADSDNFKYNIYVDSDNNGKFSRDEIVFSDNAIAGENSHDHQLSNSLTGMVQWKIEVYNVENQSEHYSETGCSALKNRTGEKIKIRVLQIMPDVDCTLDLSDSKLFRKYYEDLEDYDVTIDSITVSTFESYFSEEHPFSFDISSDISIEVNPDGTMSASNPVNLEYVGGELSKYNMFVIGFGDAYGQQDISNENGAMDYIEYYIAAGKSILFTHDLTSMYNVKHNNVITFGHTANKMLRDLMGMNAYKMISSELDERHRTQLAAYQQKEENSSKYSVIDSMATQGYTYYALKRMGWYNDSYTFSAEKKDENGNTVYDSKGKVVKETKQKYTGTYANYTGSTVNRVIYKNMITNPLEEFVCTATAMTKNTGFNNNNDITTKASLVNVGQITEYPYKIGESLEIAPTHGQWYQLSMEDENVTVWYALADDGSASTAAGDDSKVGTALTYGVSPNDGANNYYIYSKDNVFYSGVGHETVTGAMEAKLFINTMIAAYRAAYEPPVIEVTNDEAVLTANQTYSVELLQNFENIVPDTSTGQNQQQAETFTDSDIYQIKFMPIEFNAKASKLEGAILFKNGDGNFTYIDKIYDSEGNLLKADPVTHKFKLENGHEYYLEYPKKYLDLWKDEDGNTHSQIRDVIFYINNDLVAELNMTTLHIGVSPLFQLD